MNSNSKLFPDKRWPLIGIVLGVVLGFVVPYCVRLYRDSAIPKIDHNSSAYISLLEGGHEREFAKAKPYFDQAYSGATDEELKYLADFFSRTCQLALDYGIKTSQEANSVAGGLKAFAGGYLNPLNGVEGGVLWMKAHFGDYEKNCNIADQRYQARTRDYVTAVIRRNETPSFYWWMVLATPIVLYLFKEPKPSPFTSARPRTQVFVSPPPPN